VARGLSECSEAQLIGKALAGTRDREGLTQIQLSKLTGIPQRHISEMENGKRPIGKEMAKRLGKPLASVTRCFCRIKWLITENGHLTASPGSP